jgi:hypothetical protein
LIEQAGGEIVLRPAADLFIKNFLSLMFSLYPEKYGTNLLNYHKFWDFFGEKKIINSFQNRKNNTKIQEDIGGKTMEGVENTKIFEWVTKIFGN